MRSLQDMLLAEPELSRLGRYNPKLYEFFLSLHSISFHPFSSCVCGEETDCFANFYKSITCRTIRSH